MRLHQPVGAEPADEEGARQNPERRTARRLEQDLKGAAEGRCRRDMGWSIASVAIRLEADILRLVDDKQNHEEGDQYENDNRRRQRDAPAVTIGEPRRERQEDELAGRARRAQNPDREAAPRRE